MKLKIYYLMKLIKAISNILRVGIDFYTNLNRLEDKVLEAHNYSREEIEQGLHDLSSEYGINLS